MKTMWVRSRRGLLMLPLIAVLLLGLSVGCSKDNNNNPYDNGGGDQNPGGNTVSIQNNAFSPGTLTVPVGTTVTWTNHDGIAHTVTAGTPGSPSGAFSSGNLAGNATFSHTFSAAGSFPYFCSIHTGMRGTITVQ